MKRVMSRFYTCFSFRQLILFMPKPLTTKARPSGS